ncbi:hypothetical protein EV356DRAFT_520090 [Viridothelium virens]|uniref:AA1-like domain-containing protein n=1 Tax=Viridothelium virens TaxID=1048519 RepID=A0A6A6GX30_VIRVR|nr:hypothetical protein EV356DRAFT_520090 [Viridothelium virens]
MKTASSFQILLLAFLSVASTSPIYQHPFPHNEYLEPRETNYMNLFVPTNDPSMPFYTGYDVCDKSVHSTSLSWDPQLAAQIQKGNGSCVSQGSYTISINGLSAAYFATTTRGRNSRECAGEVRFQTTGSSRNASSLARIDCNVTWPAYWKLQREFDTMYQQSPLVGITTPRCPVDRIQR